MANKQNVFGQFMQYLIGPLGVGIVVLLGQLWIQPKIAHKSLVEEQQWRTKYEACLEALRLADAMLSHYSWENVKDTDIIKEDIKTSEVRRCYAKLVCSCDNRDVLYIFKKIFFEPITPDIVVDLRDAIRKELGFGESIDQDREKAYFGKIFCDPAVKNESEE